MATKPSKQISTIRDKLTAGDRGGSPTDRDRLLDFSDALRLRASEYSDHRHVKLLRHCIRISENVDVENALASSLSDRDVTEAIVRWIHATYDNPETNRDYRIALRQFARHVVNGEDETVDCDDNGIPLAVAWVPSTTPSNYDPTPDPSAMLTWDDVDQLIDAARNPRDAAMVALMMDAGPRGGEFFALEVGDITDADHGLFVRLEGKTGPRSVTLIPSVPYVNRWLADHPGEDGDSLWSALTNPQGLSKQRIYQVLNRLADRAGLNTDRQPVTPTNFRKSNASHLARTGANAALIEERQGRTRGSDAVARYVAAFGEDSEQTAYARLYGRDVDDESPERRDVLECPRCGKENPPDEAMCMWCGQAFTDEAAAEAERAERSVREALAGLDADTATDVIGVVEMIDDNPELAAAFRSADE